MAQQRLLSNGSFGTSHTGDRHSRRLYVITEESQSNIGHTTIGGGKADLTNQPRHVRSGAHLQGSGYGFLKASTLSQETTPPPVIHDH